MESGFIESFVVYLINDYLYVESASFAAILAFSAAIFACSSASNLAASASASACNLRFSASAFSNSANYLSNSFVSIIGCIGTFDGVGSSVTFPSGLTVGFEGAAGNFRDYYMSFIYLIAELVKLILSSSVCSNFFCYATSDDTM